MDAVEAETAERLSGAAGALRVVNPEIAVAAVCAAGCCVERLLGYCGSPFMCQAGNSITETGSSSRAASANVRTMCCVAAERFFRISVAPQAIASRSVDFTTVSRMIADDGIEACMLSSLLLRFFDQLRKILLVFAGDCAVGHFQQRGDCLLRRAAEKRLHHMLQCIRADLARIVGGQVDIFQSFLFVPQVSFVFQKSQHAAYGGVAGWVRNVSKDLGHGGPAAAVNHVHNLAFAPPKLKMLFVAHD